MAQSREQKLNASHDALSVSSAPPAASARVATEPQAPPILKNVDEIDLSVGDKPTVGRLKILEVRNSTNGVGGRSQDAAASSVELQNMDAAGDSQNSDFDGQSSVAAPSDDESLYGEGGVIEQAYARSEDGDPGPPPPLDDIDSDGGFSVAAPSDDESLYGEGGVIEQAYAQSDDGDAPPPPPEGEPPLLNSDDDEEHLDFAAPLSSPPPGHIPLPVGDVSSPPPVMDENERLLLLREAEQAEEAEKAEKATEVPIGAGVMGMMYEEDPPTGSSHTQSGTTRSHDGSRKSSEGSSRKHRHSSSGKHQRRRDKSGNDGERLTLNSGGAADGGSGDRKHKHRHKHKHGHSRSGHGKQRLGNKWGLSATHSLQYKSAMAQGREAERRADAELAWLAYVRAQEVATVGGGPDWLEVGQALVPQGGLRRKQGQLQEAIELYRQALVVFEASVGPETLETAAVLNNLASIAMSQNSLDHALDLYSQSLKIVVIASPNTPLHVLVLNNVAQLQRKKGQLDESLATYESALAVARVLTSDGGRRVGPSTSESDGFRVLARAMHNVGQLHRHRGDGKSALALYRESVALWRKVARPGEPGLAMALVGLAALVKAEDGDMKRAQSLFREAEGALAHLRSRDDCTQVDEGVVEAVAAELQTLEKCLPSETRRLSMQYGVC